MLMYIDFIHTSIFNFSCSKKPNKIILRNQV